MNRKRFAVPAPRAVACSLFFLLVPVLGFAMPAGAPPLSPAARAALSSAAEGRGLQPWQRHFMRGLAARPAAPTSATIADGQWSALPPPALREAPGVHDAAGNRMLVYGGTGDDNWTSNELWAMSLTDPPTWSLVQTTGPKPPPRGGATLLFYPNARKLLLFAGADSITRNDLWSLDVSAASPAWVEEHPQGTPPARRAYCQAVFDDWTDRVLIFGGADSVQQQGGPMGFLADTWVVNFGTTPLVWQQITPAGTSPSPRAGAAVVFDQLRDRMVLVGGYDGGVLADAHVLTLGPYAWAPFATSGGPPPPRAIPAAVYDHLGDRMVLFGGFAGASLADTWTLDLETGAWTELSPAGGPPSARQFPAAIFHPAGNRMVLFGGSDDSGSALDPLWSLSLGGSPAWTDLGGRRPPWRFEAATTVDPTRQVMWVHGGDAWDNEGRVTRSDLWKLTLPASGTPAWSQPATTGTPLGRRYGHSVVYDSLRDRLVFFGGNDTTSFLDDTWVLTLSGTPAWSQISPAGTRPDARMYHSAVYDASWDRMIVMGGWTGSAETNDVWELFFDPISGGPAWNKLAPGGTEPPSLWGATVALDRQANRLIVFGGGSSSGGNDVYALTLGASPAWTQLSPGGPLPPPRQFASMVSLGTRMLVYGGRVDGSSSLSLDDSWLLTLYPTPSWRQMDVGSTLPSPRWGNCAGFDQATFRLAVFGGAMSGAPDGNTWILQLDEVVPAMASLVGANASPGRVELEWELSSSYRWATVYRSQADGAWAALGTVATDGTGRLTYVDLDVIAGARYGYRLGLPGEGGEVFASEVWVEVPAIAQFALAGMAPNPGPAGTGLIRFSLPDAAPAQLEVLDVSGRRVFSRAVGSLGAGEHFVRVGGASMAPGLYMVRLTRGDRALTAKVVATR